MRPRHHPASLWQIVEIRGLQRLAAENAVEHAAATLRTKQLATKVAEQECQRIEENWLAVLASRSFSLDLAGAWSAALLQQESTARQARSEVGQAEAELDQRRRKSREAMAHDDVARELARTVSRDWRRYHDENRITNMTERFVQRRWQG
jgi:hypothetical protein